MVYATNFLSHTLSRKIAKTFSCPVANRSFFPRRPPACSIPVIPVPKGLIQTDKKAFAPRVGVAWDPRGSGRWLISSAYGIFYDPYYTGQGGPLQTPISAPPYLQTPQISLPNFSDPFNGSNPFNQSFAHPMSLLTLDPKLGLPYAQDWNLNIEHSLGNNWLFEIGYIGTKGTKLPRFVEGNPAAFVAGATSPNNADHRRLYSGCTIAQSSPCTFSSVGLISGNTNSTYHALQTSLRKRFTEGFSMLGSYTFSKTLDDVSSFNITGFGLAEPCRRERLGAKPLQSVRRARPLHVRRAPSPGH
jgi:hypothetical protein